MPETMTPMERVLTTLQHREPDRVPYFLLVTMHGAKELGVSLREYFSSADHVVEGQLRLRKKYGHDCLNPFFYGALDYEAWGGEVIYFDDGPPNSGEPVISRPEKILSLSPPRISEAKPLHKAIEATRRLTEIAAGNVIVTGTAISPFSLPVMQMGFDNYIELIYERRELFWKLMELNEEFFVEWVSAQLDAGASAIIYFDPLSSPNMLPKKLFRETGYLVAKRVFNRLKSPMAFHLASGITLPVVEDLIDVGATVIGVSAKDDLALMKEACRGSVTLLGNLNGIEMVRWTEDEAREKTKETLMIAGPGGGFILADNHGEIPFQVPDETLLAISETVHKWGNYPLNEGPL